MTARSLERVIYYENYMVVDPGKTPLELKQLLTDNEYRQAIDEYGMAMIRPYLVADNGEEKAWRVFRHL